MRKKPDTGGKQGERYWQQMSYDGGACVPRGHTSRKAWHSSPRWAFDRLKPRRAERCAIRNTWRTWRTWQRGLKIKHLQRQFWSAIGGPEPGGAVGTRG